MKQRLVVAGPIRNMGNRRMIIGLSVIRVPMNFTKEVNT